MGSSGINAKPKKSAGPDNLSNTHMKHLGPIAIAALTLLYNKALNTNTIPHTWKTANIIPILKPNKNKNNSTSYRPIALLSPIAKTLEIIILNLIKPHTHTHTHTGPHTCAVTHTHTHTHKQTNKQT